MSTTLSRTAALDVSRLVRERFPLVPRTKPACRSLEERVGRVCHLAHLVGQHPDQALTSAAEAHNLAALIASDCGMPNLARTLCWRQLDLVRHASPHTAETAKVTLQPVINLARLHIRDGNGTAAYQLLEALFHAAKTQTDTVIDDRTVNIGGLVANVQDHREVVRWLWTIMLADGTRALTRAGRWAEALTHLLRHRGIGERLLDGRQVAILAAQDPNHPLRLLAATQTPTPWEKAVATCLRVIRLQQAGYATNPAVTEMVHYYLALDPEPEHAAFHTRLGICIIELATVAGQEIPAEPAGRRLVEHAVTSGDAYAAREVLTHPNVERMAASDQMAALAQLLDASGLNLGAMPANLEHDLMTSVGASEKTIERTLLTASPAEW